MINKYKKAELDQAYVDCFSSRAGKIVMYDLITRHQRRAVYEGDSNKVIFNEGARSVVVAIINKLEAARSDELKEIVDERNRYG